MAGVGPGQRRLLRLALELGVKTKPVHTRGRSVMMLRGERTECVGPLPRLGSSALLDVHAALMATEKVSREVDLSRPWTEGILDGKSLDSMTIEEWRGTALCHQPYCNSLIFSSICCFALVIALSIPDASTRHHSLPCLPVHFAHTQF